METYGALKAGLRCEVNSCTSLILSAGDDRTAAAKRKKTRSQSPSPDLRGFGSPSTVSEISWRVQVRLRNVMCDDYISVGAILTTAD
ncbi:hypothetical protein TcasGA2_TC003162 [Tribolium castaneum]|uniref:Uncharacterized protein n=1 Tax=Tribolium castaneum TaxID=7070 RepID=D6WEW7_TRICA|nr:hypothetical protein TcasGA2_TC003162 [Tribolium castaneum]